MSQRGMLMQFLDAETRCRLGFEEIWSQIRPRSSLGKSLHRKAQPFLPAQSAELEKELERLEQIAGHFRRDPQIDAGLGHLLGGVRDVTGSIRRSLQGLRLDDTELYEIKKLLYITKKVQAEIDSLGWNGLLPIPLDSCPRCREALSLGQGSRESFYLVDDYDEELAQVRQKRLALEDSLAGERASVENKIKAAVGRVLSMDDEVTVSTTEEEKIAKLAEIEGLRKVEETPDFVRFRLAAGKPVRQIQQELALVREQEERCKDRVRRQLTEIVGQHGESLLEILGLLGFLDFLLAKAKLCAAFNGIRPRLGRKPTVFISQGRHLVLEEEVTRQGLDYTPLDLEFKTGVTMITGPNMGGKTASLKTVGLLIAMAQFGLLVPAAAMEFKPRRFIAAHLSSAGNPAGLSSFAGEIAFIRDAVEVSDQDGLILLDEIAHGTNPAEGAVIAQAVIENLNEKSSITVITTHYPALAGLKRIRHLRVKGLDHDKLRQAWQTTSEFHLDIFHRAMDYRLEPAGLHEPFSSDAAVVAEALGLDEKIVLRAKELLQNCSPGQRRECPHD